MPEGTIRRQAIGNENSLPARANAATRRQMLIGTAGVFGCLTLAFAEVRPSGTGDISSACEVIHQEVVFKAIPKRVYEALTDAKQFNKVVLLSAAVFVRTLPKTSAFTAAASAAGSTLTVTAASTLSAHARPRASRPRFPPPWPM